MKRASTLALSILAASVALVAVAAAHPHENPAAKPAPKKGTKLVLLDFSCSPAYNECEAQGGINGADACRQRTVTMLFNGKKIGSVKSDVSIGSFHIEDVPFAGAGRYTIRVEPKDTAKVFCKQASTSGVVFEDGSDTFDL